MLRPTAYQVPIYVEDPVMDLRCCCFGMTYAQTLLVRNRGKVALKVLPQVPPQMRGLGQFTPDMAYVQARDPHTRHHQWARKGRASLDVIKNFHGGI
jgi:hypothetical protein